MQNFVTCLEARYIIQRQHIVAHARGACKSVNPCYINWLRSSRAGTMYARESTLAQVVSRTDRLAAQCSSTRTRKYSSCLRVRRKLSRPLLCREPAQHYLDVFVRPKLQRCWACSHDTSRSARRAVERVESGIIAKSLLLRKEVQHACSRWR